jgi:hypothetical protein
VNKLHGRRTRRRLSPHAGQHRAPFDVGRRFSATKPTSAMIGNEQASASPAGFDAPIQTFQNQRQDRSE